MKGYFVVAVMAVRQELPREELARPHYCAGEPRSSPGGINANRIGFTQRS
jgi:hypothetical protein